MTRADEIARRCLDALRKDLPELAVDNADDPAVALVGAWATVVDLLDFYRDRIAEEGYLATAAEHRSVVELGRAVGFRPRPAVAASVLLSFSAAQVPEAVVAAGTAVRSIPAQDEVVQVFETETDLRVLPERTRVPLRERRPQRVRGPLSGLRVLTTGLRAGDHVLVRPNDQDWVVRVLTDVVTGPDGVTAIAWADPVAVPEDVVPEVHVFRVRTGLFGHNAPDWRAMPDTVKSGYGGVGGTQWPSFGAESTRRIDGLPTVELADVHLSIVPDSWLVLRTPGKAGVLRTVKAVRTSSVADFALAGPVTSVAIPGPSLPAEFDRRSTVVLAQSEPLVLADEPDTDVVRGPVLDLAEPVAFDAGATVIVEGNDVTGAPVVRSATVEASDGTALTLSEPLPVGVVQATAAVLGNVVAATAGETTAEVLGSGDGSLAHQRFSVRVAEIGHVPAATSRGFRSTLDVLVDGTPWTEVDDPLSAGPRDRVFSVLDPGDGLAVVCFGDGVHGARLPTGDENVHAVYRTSGGAAGNVGAGVLRLLSASPLGVIGVDNPLPATGGADRLSADEARALIPRVVRTLDRVVSPADHLDFALAFAGVRKAAMTVFTRGTRPLVHLTVVPDDDTGGVVRDLRLALAAARTADGDLDVQRCQYTEFDAAMEVLPVAQGGPEVVAAVVEAVREAFGPGRGRLADPVAAAELIAVAQRVPGVEAVRMTALSRRGSPAAPHQVLDARPAVLGETGAVPAELLVLHEITVREVVR